MGNENTGRKVSRTFGQRKNVSDCLSNSTTPLLKKSRVQDKSDELLKESPSLPAEKAMRAGNKISKTVGPRKRLTDITNTPLLFKSRVHEEDDQILQESLAQLQDELIDVKKTLAEKEVHIEENKRYMQKLWLNYCRKTKQNDEIILHNSQLGKDLTQALEKVKILEHENVQMSALYKFCKSELQQKQQKLTEALEEVDRLTKLLEASMSEKALADQNERVKSGVTDGYNSCASIHGRTVLRKRQRMHYKEPSLKQKMRQEDGEVLCVEQPEHNDDSAVAEELGKAEGCEAVSASRKNELVWCDHTSAAQELGKAETHEAVSTSSKKELVQYMHTAAARELGKAEGCKVVMTSIKKEPDQCDHTEAGHKLSKAEGRKAVPQSNKKEPCQGDYIASTQKVGKAEEWRAAQTSSKELNQCDHTVNLQKLGKAEGCKAVVVTSGEKDLEMIEGKLCLGRQCVGRENVHMTKGEQVLNEVHLSTQKLSERPSRRAASSIGSYKEPPLNTKMRRAA